MLRLAVLFFSLLVLPATAAPGPIAGTLGEAALWAKYKTLFVKGDGRVIDNANGNISHSEGQGFAMIIAVGANDPATFAKLWGFAKNNLAVRKDSLFAWKWTPGVFGGKVTDSNNATDGDILIAWALLEAHQAGFGDYRAEAFKILADVKPLILPAPYGPIVMPAAQGFDAKAQGSIVINLSYWVFPAFKRLADLTGDTSWLELFDSGEALIAAASQNKGGLPADWTALQGRKATTAKNFANDFSYNAVRIPLYLAWANPGSPSLRQFQANWVGRKALSQVDVTNGRATGTFADVGYRAIAATADCAVSSKRFPSSLKGNLDPLYYPASLHLLSIMAVKQVYPSCW